MYTVNDIKIGLTWFDLDLMESFTVNAIFANGMVSVNNGDGEISVEALLEHLNSGDCDVTV